MKDFQSVALGKESYFKEVFLQCFHVIHVFHREMQEGTRPTALVQKIRG